MLGHSPDPPFLIAPQTATRTTPPSVPPQLPAPVAAPFLPADANLLFGQLFKIVYRRRWRLALFVAAAMLLAVFIQIVSPRLYSASALLRLDRHSAPGAIGQEASQISAINDMDVIIDTDMQIAQSDPVVRPVAEKYHLIGGHRRPGLLSRLFDGKAAATNARRDALEPINLGGLKIARPANTYLIRITYQSWKDAQQAADIANGVAESLVNHLHESLDRSYSDLSGAMRKDMDQLRAKMDDSSQKLTQYEKELNMVDPEQRSTVLTSRLTQLLADYTAAQSDRLKKQALVDGITKSPTLAATQATEADRQRQSLLDEALTHLATVRQQFVAARSYYGENHPDYRRAKQQLDEAQAQVETMRIAANDKAAAEYRQAQSREALLKNQFDQAKGEVDRLKAHALAYSELKTEAENDRRMYMELESRMRDSDVNRQFRDATIQFAAPALPPGGAIFPKLSVNLPIAFLLSLLLGVGGAVAADALDNTFFDADDMSARMRFEVLGALPHVRGLSAIRQPQTSNLPVIYRRSADTGTLYKESIRLLRDSVARAMLSQSLRTILITSGTASEGKSTTAAHLARACARGGSKILLIDADLRRPSVHKNFDITTGMGLADVLAHRIPPAEVIVEADVLGLSVMPLGPPILSGSDLVDLDFSNLLNHVRKEYDLVIVDGPPVLGLPDAQVLSTMVDGVLVIAKAEVTSAKELTGTLTALNRSRANVLGVVMNQVRSSSLNGFDSYYDRYQPEAEV